MIFQLAIVLCLSSPVVLANWNQEQHAISVNESSSVRVGGSCDSDDVYCTSHGKRYMACINGRYKLKAFEKCEGCGTDEDGKCYLKAICKFKIRIENIAFRQPLSPFFVAVHTDEAQPLFEFGKKASRGLRIVAEDGNAAPLVNMFRGADGVIETFALDGPVFPAGSTEFEVYLKESYLLSVASMAINTNDAFVALNGVKLHDHTVFYLDGLDAGSEENNELCSFIPGPACASDSGNSRATGAAEGYVHVHRGFFGINAGKDLGEEDLGVSGNPLAADRYDWRNPMARVVAYKM